MVRNKALIVASEFLIPAKLPGPLLTVKALFLTKKIDYFCFSIDDFKESETINHSDIPQLCQKYKIKKNLIKPIYLS